MEGVLVKYRLEYTIDPGSSTEQEVRAYIEKELDGQDIVITEITPVIPEGWYQRMEAGQGQHVDHFSADDLAEYVEDYGLDTFTTKYRRVHPPVPWNEVEEKYTDGYYLMNDGYQYRRIDGTWELNLPGLGGWDWSSYTDETIEKDGRYFIPFEDDKL